MADTISELDKAYKAACEGKWKLIWRTQKFMLFIAAFSIVNTGILFARGKILEATTTSLIVLLLLSMMIMDLIVRKHDAREQYYMLAIKAMEGMVDANVCSSCKKTIS